MPLQQDGTLACLASAHEANVDHYYRAYTSTTISLLDLEAEKRTSFTCSQGASTLTSTPVEDTNNLQGKDSRARFEMFSMLNESTVRQPSDNFDTRNIPFPS